MNRVILLFLVTTTAVFFLVQDPSHYRVCDDKGMEKKAMMEKGEVLFTRLERVLACGRNVPMDVLRMKEPRG